jgi:transcriptional regulator with XRE-family HTH domain
MHQGIPAADPGPNPAMCPALTFGQTLRQMIRNRNLTIRAFARRSRIHPTHVGRLLKDRVQPRTATLEKMLAALGNVEGDTRHQLYALCGCALPANGTDFSVAHAPPQDDDDPDDPRAETITFTGNICGNFTGAFHYNIRIRIRPVKNSAMPSRAENDD